MPKKFHGENSKAAQARARKDAAKIADEEKRQKEIEDALWEDDDKHVQRKLQRKDEKQKKKQEVLERKAINKAIEEQEMSSIKGAAKITATKLTRAEISALQEEQLAQLAQGERTKEIMHDEKPLEENINRMELETMQARNVDEAIAVLSITEGRPDKHPEKRVKAAYQLYEETNLPILKAENPNMRLSQLKQLLKKDWMKSPENPLNQLSLSYNVK